jgi:DNA-binding LytR/AlgR family response regulator
MEVYNCLIVEDEPLSAELLRDYILQVPFLNLLEHCTDVYCVKEALQKYKVDLIFLDIHLPKMKDLDFIKTLNNPPHIIITSAYQEYAVQAFELNVTDYLLKPVTFSRFLMAVHKIEKVHEERLPFSVIPKQLDRLYLFFTVGKKKVKVFLDEILYIESMKEYIRVISETKSVLTKFKLSDIEGMLAENNFIRIHRSFIVAKDKIEAFSASELEVGGKLIPIGRSYKEYVAHNLDNNLLGK